MLSLSVDIIMREIQRASVWVGSAEKGTSQISSRFFFFFFLCKLAARLIVRAMLTGIYLSYTGSPQHVIKVWHHQWLYLFMHCTVTLSGTCGCAQCLRRWSEWVVNNNSREGNTWDIRISLKQIGKYEQLISYTNNHDLYTPHYH